ncbi:DNA-binding protein [Angelakisella massiliensis]|uniref:DNA-binding protein n=1 Tax=Angelakisella massiliensis TaxID=1871018 RepID=UPI003B84AA35
MSQVNGYITVQEAAEKWGVTPRQVQILCKENRIMGASRMSRIWIIPENAEKPTKDSITRTRKKNDKQ